MSNTVTFTRSALEPVSRLIAPRSPAWLASAVGLAMLLHVLLVLRSPLIAPDGIGFIGYAREMNVDVWSAIREHPQHPGYPLLIRGMHVVTGLLVQGDAGWEVAARLVCGIAGLLSIVLIWLLVREIVDVPAANIAAFVFALLPTLQQNAADALSDTSHLAFFVCAVWLVCRSANRRSRWNLLLAGAASGLAFWVRPEGLAAAGVSACCLVLLPAWRHSLGGTRRAVTGALVLLTGTALVAGPLILGSGKLTGKLAGKPGWQQLQRSELVSPGGPSTSTAPDVSREPVGAVPLIPAEDGPTPWTEPIAKAAVSALSCLGTSLSETLNGILLLPLFMGIALAARRMPRPAFTLCLALALAQVGMLLLLHWLGGYIGRRHLFPLIALLMPSISLGVREAADWMRRLEFRRRRLRWPAPVAVVLALLVLIPRSVRPLHQSHLHKLKAAEWVRANCESHDVIGSTAPEVVYHAARDGRACAGSVFRPGLPVEADGPLVQNTILLIETDDRGGLPEWASMIPHEFSRELEIRGDRRLRQRDIVIYRRRDGSQRTAGSAPATVRR